MFADLGHFSVPAIQVCILDYVSCIFIFAFLDEFAFVGALRNYFQLFAQIAFTCVVFPCLLLAYMGQAAYLMRFPDSSDRIFYDSVPGYIC